MTRLTKKQRKAQRKQEKRARREAEARAEFYRVAQEQADKLASELATDQHIALMRSPYLHSDPATGRPADPKMTPRGIGGPYHSKPYGFPGFRKRRRWVLRPVMGRLFDGTFVPCMSIMWSSIEVRA